jgi:GINS complex subunit 2
VPLWLAIYMVKRNQCRLRAPEWLKKSELERLLSEERGNAEAFVVLPSEAFVETASLFLEYGREQLADCERVRQLVDAIVECRKGKVLAGEKRGDSSNRFFDKSLFFV